MGTNAQHQNSYVLDEALRLSDRLTYTTTGQPTVDGSGVEIDFGGLTNAGDEVLAYTQVDVVLVVEAVDAVSGNEAYDLIWQLSDNAAFNDPTVVNRSHLTFGAAAGSGIVNSGATGLPVGTSGRTVLGVDNRVGPTVFRFGRLFHRLQGTTPSITYEAFGSILR